MKMKGKIEKSIINIALICENDNYCESKNFTKIGNYYEPEKVLFWVEAQELAVVCSFPS